MKKISLLSLVLIAASAVTAAIFPKVKSISNANFIQYASATWSSDQGGFTCRPTDEPVEQICHITLNSETTGDSASSDGNGNTTIGDLN